MDVLFCCSNDVIALDAFGLIKEKGFNIKKLLLCDDEPSDKLKDRCDKGGVEIISLIEAGSFYYGEFDLLIAFTYHKVLREETINAGKLAVNFHPAPLPYYKGVGNNMWAIVNSEKEWGATCHYLDKDIDAGKIIECRKFSVKENNITTGGELSAYSWKVCLELLNDLLDKIIRKEEILGIEQKKIGRYYSKAELDKLKCVDIERDMNNLENIVNGLWYPPYKGAYVEVDGKKYYLMTEYIAEQVFEQMESSQKKKVQGNEGVLQPCRWKHLRGDQ